MPILDGGSSVTVNWKFQAGGAVRSSTCHDGHNRVFFGSDDYNVYSVAEDSGEKLWEYATKGEVRSHCQVEAAADWDEIPTVYIGSDDGAVYGLLTESGEEKLSPFQTGAMVRNAPTVRMHVAINGTTLFTGDEDGTIHGWDVRANTERYNVPSLAQNNAAPLTPTYAFCGVVFAFKDGTIRNLSPHQFPGYEHDERDEICNGRDPIQWEFDTGSPIVAEPLTISDSFPRDIVAITENGNVFSVTLAGFTGRGGGEQRWTSAVGSDGAVYHAPMALSNDWTQLFICSSLGEVTALDAMTGTTNWKVTLPNTSCMHGGAAIDANEQIYMPTTTGIFTLSPTDGEILWEFNTDSAVTTSPSMTESGDLVFGTEAGEIFSITVKPN
jgi:outer membrane protein assembly factor BamB